MPEIGTSGSMSEDGKRSVAAWPKLPRPSSTLPTIGTIETSNDVDWFAVALTAGETYRFKSEGASTGQGTIQSLYIELHDNAGVGLIGSDGPTGFTYTATSSATYYLATGGNGVGVLGTYKVSAADLGAITDDYAASTATTGVVAVGGSTPGTIETSNDQDWFAVTLTAGETYQFKSEGAHSGQGSLNDPFLQLLDHNGIATAGLGSSFPGDAGFRYTATSTATYYLVAGSSGATDYGTYRVSATDLGATNRAPTAVNDTATAATGIGGTASGNVLGNDSDPDGDTLVVTPFSGTGAHGNLIINADGSYNYSVTNLWGPTGSHLHDIFTYGISDGHGGVRVR